MPARPVVGGAHRGRPRPAGTGGGGRGRRPAARHGRARRLRRGHQGRDAVERREVGAAGGGAGLGIRRAGRVGGPDRVGPDHVVHRHQAPLAGRERARPRRPGAPGAAAARLADLEAGRRGRAGGADHGPGGRLGDRVLLPRRGRLAAGLRRARPRPAGRAAAGGRARGGGGANPVGRGPVRGHRGQHGRGARTRPARRRRGGVHRHVRDRVRGHRAASRPIPAGWSAASPTRPAGTCRSPARSTRLGCST